MDNLIYAVLNGSNHIIMPDCRYTRLEILGAYSHAVNIYQDIISSKSLKKLRDNLPFLSRSTVGKLFYDLCYSASINNKEQLLDIWNYAQYTKTEKIRMASKNTAFFIITCHIEPFSWADLLTIAKNSTNISGMINVLTPDNVYPVPFGLTNFLSRAIIINPLFAELLHKYRGSRYTKNGVQVMCSYFAKSTSTYSMSNPLYRKWIEYIYDNALNKHEILITISKTCINLTCSKIIAEIKTDNELIKNAAFNNLDMLIKYHKIFTKDEFILTCNNNSVPLCGILQSDIIPKIGIDKYFSIIPDNPAFARYIQFDKLIEDPRCWELLKKYLSKTGSRTAERPLLLFEKPLSDISSTMQIRLSEYWLSLYPKAILGRPLSPTVVVMSSWKIAIKYHPSAINAIIIPEDSVREEILEIIELCKGYFPSVAEYVEPQCCDIVRNLIQNKRRKTTQI